MKNFLIYCLAILVSTAAFTSCEKDNEGPSGTNGDGAVFSVMLDGTPYVAEGLYAYAADWGETINAYGLADNEYVIYVSMPKNIAAGQTYTFDGTKTFAILDLPDGHEYTTILEGGEGQLTITSFDGENIKGTFTFTAVDYYDPTNKVSATDGEFNVAIRF